MHQAGETVRMDFDAILAQTLERLEAEGRISYRALKRRFDLTDDDIEDIKAELIHAKGIATDENGHVLVRRRDGFATDRGESTASRRQLSVMFCDVVGSTALSTRIDAEELRDLLRTYQGICSRVVHDYGGHVAQYLGDGLLVYFGYPKAHEKAAQNAVEAGLEIIRDIQESKRLQTRGPRTVEVRIGVHTGPVVIGEMGDERHKESLAVGETPNVAARVQGCAEPNQLVVSNATRKVAGDGFQYQDRGSRKLKGISTRVQLWQVLEPIRDSQSHRSLIANRDALIGRDDELRRLTTLWSQTQNGQGAFSVVTGEPGIGKSRLVDEALALAVSDGAHHYKLRCDERFSQSPFFSIIEFLAQIEINDADGDRWRTTMLGEDTPYLDALLGTTTTNDIIAEESPETRRANTLRALTRLFQCLGEAGPTVCVWEDIHAADPSTLELLGILSETVSATPVLHLAASRPSEVFDWSRRPQATHITVMPLNDSNSRALAESTADDVTLSSVVLDQIVSTTDGIPLFVEEMTKMLLESNWLREEDGQFVFAQKHASSAIPITLQDSLMARLDQLPAGLPVAQYAATIGREFSDILLDEVVDARVLKDGIAQLIHAGLIQRTDPTPTEYRFKHALVSDTAYQSLLKSERRVYHRQIADAIERVKPETVQNQPELVARHWTEAGRVDRALPLWKSAGERAIGRSANREALHHLETGSNLLSALPHTAARDRQDLDLRMAMGPVLITLKGNAAPEVEMCYERARYLCGELRDDTHAFAATFGLRSYYLAHADLAHSHNLGESLLRIATKNADADEQIEAHAALSNTYFFYGDFAAVQKHVDAGIELYCESMHASHAQTYGLDPGVVCLSRAAQALWHRGFPDSAVEVMNDAIALAERLQHPFTTAYLYDNAAVLHQWRREGSAARRWAESAITLSTRFDFPFFRAWGLMQAGHALVQLGYTDDGFASMHEGMAIADSIGVLLMQPWFFATWGEACLSAKRFAEGLRYVEDGIAVVEHTGAAYAAPALFLLKGEFLMPKNGDSNFTAAQQSLLKAKSTAAAHGSLGYELRAAMALCRLGASQGRGEIAGRQLADVYGSFREGFSTLDLQDAKTLLAESG